MADVALPALNRFMPAQVQAGPPDYSGRYNTPLSPEEEAAFQAWGRQQAARTGRDPTADQADYDMRGAWRSGAAAGEGGHFPDTFKKPNHPTFSTQSQYSGVDGAVGGVWQGGQGGQPWVFAPSPTNLQIHGADALQRYFQEVEPGNRLLLPPAGP